jgi:predicted O-methyltransferase YrrM
MPIGFLSIYRRWRYPDDALVLRESVPFSLPQRLLTDLFPGVEKLGVEISVSEINRPFDMYLPLVELLTLIAICKYKCPKRVFEIGTYTGSTTLSLAISSTETTQVYTLDLPNEFQKKFTIPGVVGSAFQNTSVSSRIHQLWGDSRTFDFTPFLTNIDLVFIDGSHNYDVVCSDSENAFKLLTPGGVIIWDDYLWELRHPSCAGVTRCLNELRKSKKCFLISGTRLAVYIND